MRTLWILIIIMNSFLFGAYLAQQYACGKEVQLYKYVISISFIVIFTCVSLINPKTR